MIFDIGGYRKISIAGLKGGNSSVFRVVELETSNSKLETNQPTAKTFYSSRQKSASEKKGPRDPTRDCGAYIPAYDTYSEITNIK